MTSTVSNQPVFVPGTIYNGTIDVRVLDESGPTRPSEVAYEIGLWLAGLEGFVTGFEGLFAEKDPGAADPKIYDRAFRLTGAGLYRSIALLDRLRLVLQQNGSIDTPAAEDSKRLSMLLREAIRSNQSLSTSTRDRSNEWKRLRSLIADDLSNEPSFRSFAALARNCPDDAVPEAVSAMIERVGISETETAETCGVLRKFASMHKALSIVGRMLRNDEPLKPTLLIFALVYEQAQHLISQINHRLSTISNEETEFFVSLDAASYTASLEIKKAFQQELTGVVGTRTAQTIYARVEVAHSLLSSSFEEIIAGFARSIDPSAHVSTIYPRFRTKLEQSLILRSSLYSTLRAVGEAEAEAEEGRIETMRNTLELFTHEAFHFLYYKDKETLERFTEEIQLTRDPKDLVPILHRFGAYLETLLGQVSMRAVLADHPFDPNPS